MPSGHSLGRRWRRLRAEVLARSNVCYLCGHPIDLTLNHEHPMSATVDHIEPRKVAPWRTLDPTNVAPAHLRCNSRKNDQIVGDAMPTSEAW